MNSREETAKKALKYHHQWIDRDEADDKRTLSFVIADFALEVVESQRPAIEAEAVREFVDRLAADLDKCKGWHGIKEDDLHVGLMDFAKHRAREVAAEMGISLEGK